MSIKPGVSALFLSVVCWAFLVGCGGNPMERISGSYEIDIERTKQELIAKAEAAATNEFTRQIAVVQAEAAAAMLAQLPGVTLVLNPDASARMSMGLQQTEGTWVVSEELGVVELTLPESKSDMGKIMLGKIDGECLIVEGTGSSEAVFVFCRK